MTKKQLAGNDGPQPKAETLAVVHDAIAYIVAVTRIVLQRGLAEVLATTAEKIWPLMMQEATDQQKATFRELLLKIVQADARAKGRRRILTDDRLFKRVTAAARKAFKEKNTNAK